MPAVVQTETFVPKSWTDYQSKLPDAEQVRLNRVRAFSIGQSTEKVFGARVNTILCYVFPYETQNNHPPSTQA